ncbi:MAG: hypothetical protein B0D91_05885 [Oceanospirillales bacterium LUC14_002_19_P2]|nr:MAG: hypothetical protein B0D91_05885 [Oceanospirillales bacterium LUC14_002_19_P2]
MCIDSLKSQPSRLRLFTQALLITLILLIAATASANPAWGTAYQQLQKTLIPGNDTTPSKDSNPIGQSDALAIVENQAELQQLIDNLQQALGGFKAPERKSDNLGLRKLSTSALQALLQQQQQNIQTLRHDIDQNERHLLMHASERIRLQQTLADIREKWHNRLTVPIRLETLPGEDQGLLLREKQLEECVSLITLNARRLNLELQLARLTLTQAVQTHTVLEQTLATKGNALTNHQDPYPETSEQYLDETEQLLRDELSQTRRDLIDVRELAYELHTQIRDLGNISEAYDLLVSQRDRLLQQRNHSGSNLKHTLRLKRSLLAEQLKHPATTEPERLSVRLMQEQRLNRLDMMIPLADELQLLEQELHNLHDSLLKALEQQRMWMAVSPPLTPAEIPNLLKTFYFEGKTLLDALLCPPFRLDGLVWLASSLLPACLLALYLIRRSRRQVNIYQKNDVNLSVQAFLHLIGLLCLRCLPVPLWLLLASLSLQEGSPLSLAISATLPTFAAATLGWLMICAFLEKKVQSLIGPEDTIQPMATPPVRLLAATSLVGLFIGGFTNHFFTDPFDDRILQTIMVTCGSLQLIGFWLLAGLIRNPFGYDWFSHVLRIILPGLSLLLLILALTGYNLAAWTLFLHQQILLILFGLLFIAYELTLYLLYIRTRRIMLQQALHRRRETDGAIEPEDALAYSRSTILQTREQNLRILQLSFLLALIGIVAWIIEDCSDLMTPLGEIQLWPFSHMDAGLTLALGATLKALVIFVILIILTRNLPGLLRLSLPTRFIQSPSSAYALTRIVNYLIWFIGIVTMVSTLGIGWEKLQWPILAASVGIGFGLQEIVGNFFSGLIILFEKPFRVGDTVTVNDIHGTVREIRIRATVIEDFDRKELIIPNKTLVTGQVTNWSLSTSILRIQLWYGVAHGSDNDLVYQLLLRAAEESTRVLKEPAPEVYFIEYNEYAEKYELRVFVNHVDDRFPAKNQVNNRVKVLFREQGIQIAHLQQDIFIQPWSGGQRGKKSVTQINP